MLYFSLSSSQTYDLGSAANVSDEDILSFDGSDFNFLFDGSDVGISDNDVDAFYFAAENTFLLSLTTSVSLDNFGAVDDSDILQFNASSSGNNTSGIWSMYFDGSDVGLDASGEDIDAFTILSNGRILISTSGNFSVSGASGNDEDIILFTPTSIGNNTAGAMEIYFDSSDIGITDDIDGIELGSAGQLFFSSSGTISPVNITAYDEDILFCLTKNLGSNTDCEFSSELFFDGSSWGLSKHDLDAISIQ